MAETKILVTGATGATGGNAVQTLLELKLPVRALVHQMDAPSEQLSAQGVRIVPGNLSDFGATPVLHGGDDQIVPITDSAILSSKLIKNAALKVYNGAPHGVCTTLRDKVSAELLASIKA